MKTFYDYCHQNLDAISFWQADLCKQLDAVTDGTIKRLMVTAPARAGKTQIVSRLYIPYLLQETDWTIIHAGLSKTVSDMYLRKAEFTADKRVTYTHLGGSLVGVGMFNVAIIDGWDLDHAPKSMLESAYEWYAGQFVTRLASNAAIIYVGQHREGIAKLIRESDYWQIVDGDAEVK
jgi:hypothetical protein